MKQLVRMTFSAIFLFIFSASFGFAAEVTEHEIHEHKTGIETLSPDLRALLSQEMKALQEGMVSIIPAYISGNWAEIESTAHKMKSSYILKQSITKDQVKELRAKLPSEFVEKDQKFHYLAGMLAHAADMKKPELINFYFSEMNESCISCHSKFATHKFPALKIDTESEHTH